MKAHGAEEEEGGAVMSKANNPMFQQNQMEGEMPELEKGSGIGEQGSGGTVTIGADESVQLVNLMKPAGAVSGRAIVWVPLGTDAMDHPRRLLPGWRSEDQAERRDFLMGIAQAAAEADASEVVESCPRGNWAAPEKAGYVESRQFDCLEPERFADLMWVNRWLRDRKIGVGAFTGIGCPDTWLPREARFRAVRDPAANNGKGWNYLDIGKSFYALLGEYEWMWNAAITRVYIDHLSGFHAFTGKADELVKTIRGNIGSSMEVVGEGYMPTTHCSNMMMAWQIDATGSRPRGGDKRLAPNRRSDICLVSGHSTVEKGGGRPVRTAEDQVECAQRFIADGWEIAYTAASAADVEKLVKAGAFGKGG